jgi:hypothetical protein
MRISHCVSLDKVHWFYTRKMAANARVGWSPFGSEICSFSTYGLSIFVKSTHFLESSVKGIICLVTIRIIHRISLDVLLYSNIRPKAVTQAKWCGEARVALSPFGSTFFAAYP